MTRIFLLTVSNQYNACNLILRLMPLEISCIPITTETTKIKDIHTATITYTTQFYQSYIANNKPNKHNPNNQNNDTNVGFTTNTKLVPSQLRQRKFWSIHIQILTNFKIFIFK